MSLVSQLPLQGVREVLFWGTLLWHSRSWSTFSGVLIAYTTEQKRWILHRDCRLHGTALRADCTNSALPQAVTAACSAALSGAGWCPVNCHSPGLADTFRNLVQKEKAGGVQGSRLPHPRGKQWGKQHRCYAVMVALRFTLQCGDLAVRLVLEPFSAASSSKHW